MRILRFPKTFNTVPHSKSLCKLFAVLKNASLVGWISDFHPEHSQHAHFNYHVTRPWCQFQHGFANVNVYRCIPRRYYTGKACMKDGACRCSCHRSASVATCIERESSASIQHFVSVFAPEYSMSNTVPALYPSKLTVYMYTTCHLEEEIVLAHKRTLYAASRRLVLF